MPQISSGEFQQGVLSGSPHSRSTERRRDVRYPTNDRAQVEVLHANIQHLSALVLDVSRSGLRLGIEERIQPGLELKITLPRQVVIFGEVRYCRRVGKEFHAGVLITQLFQSVAECQQHLHNDEFGFYLVGKGLTATELLRVREHLVHCGSCRLRLAETDAMLNPVNRRKAQ
jgi:PilZ domain-containing protein